MVSSKHSNGTTGHVPCLVLTTKFHVSVRQEDCWQIWLPIKDKKRKETLSSLIDYWLFNQSQSVFVLSDTWYFVQSMVCNMMVMISGRCARNFWKDSAKILQQMGLLRWKSQSQRPCDGNSQCWQCPLAIFCFSTATQHQQRWNSLKWQQLFYFFFLYGQNLSLKYHK